MYVPSLVYSGYDKECFNRMPEIIDTEINLRKSEGNALKAAVNRQAFFNDDKAIKKHTESFNKLQSSDSLRMVLHRMNCLITGNIMIKST